MACSTLLPWSVGDNTEWSLTLCMLTWRWSSQSKVFGLSSETSTLWKYSKIKRLLQMRKRHVARGELLVSGRCFRCSTISSAGNAFRASSDGIERIAVTSEVTFPDSNALRKVSTYLNTTFSMSTAETDAERCHGIRLSFVRHSNLLSHFSSLAMGHFSTSSQHEASIICFRV